MADPRDAPHQKALAKAKPSRASRLPPRPSYPTKAKAAKITGMAAVLIRVTGNGSTGSTSLYRSSGNTELDQAAIVAARG